MHKCLLSQDIDQVVVPALGILTELFQVRSDLVDDSEILDPETLSDIDLGRLLRNQKFTEFTDFVFTTTSEQFNHVKTMIEELQAAARENKAALN